MSKNSIYGEISYFLHMYIHNPYVIVGYGDCGLIWRDESLLSIREALKVALTYVHSHKRLQNLVLFAPPPYLLQSQEDIAFLCANGVKLDIYVGERDEGARTILEALHIFGVVRYYKDIFLAPPFVD